MTQRHVEQLSPEACIELLKQSNVGRIIFVDDHGPGAFPVNYGMAGDEVVFRIEQGSALRSVLKDPVGFEVDNADPEQGAGWSVLIRGAASEVPIDEVPELLKALRNSTPRPWAEGIHNIWVTIEMREVTGRRLADSFISPT